MGNIVFLSYFSKNYEQARSQFTQVASQVGANVDSLAVQKGYHVDVATLGCSGSPTLVISSGLHGVEAFFGSAVQLAVMHNLQNYFNKGLSPDELRFVFVHAINPYGFDHIRRVDEENVDLNRNFHTDITELNSAPAAYQRLNGFLNPPSPPSKYEPYRLKALFNIARYGVPALKEAIVSGQYQYPEGIFYGGRKTSVATETVMQSCEMWAGNADVVAHIDLHTGLGEYGSYKLLLNEGLSEDELAWHRNTFGPENLGSMQSEDKTAYAVSGSMGAWLQNKFSDRQYYFAGAEFGTYESVRVLGAIRAENRAHHYSEKDSASYLIAKAELLECFCPASETWRRQVVDSSLQIVSSAIEGLRRA